MSRRLSMIVTVAVVISSLQAACPAIADAQDGSELIDQIKRGETRLDQAVRVDGFKLNTGIGTVHLSDGVLVPASPLAGRPVEFVFVGDGRVVLDPIDDVERGQLEVFTGKPVLDETIEQAVFVITLDQASDALTTLPSAGDDQRVKEAAGILDQWRASPERRLLDVNARLLRDAMEDPLGRGFFCGYFDGIELGRFLWVVDPLAEEQISLGQFVRPELTKGERRKAARHLEREQRRGKLIGRQLGDLGIWNTWVSLSLETVEGEPAPGSPGVESRHYELELELSGKQLALEATARIEMTVLVNGLSVVTLDMADDLVVQGVTNGDGLELQFVQSHDELTVLLARPRSTGDGVTLVVEYSGRAIDRLASGAYAQRRPTRWYPRAGAIDRATYDFIARWPKKYRLVGSGSVADEGVDGGTRWQRRVLDGPALGFSFEVGDYEIATGVMGDTQITVAIDRLAQGVSDRLADEILDSVRGPLAYFESIFGPYPLEELVVVSTPRAYSQGLLGFVTLSTVGIVDWDVWGELLGFEDRRLLIAHELAHQWWGNQVGWRNYRDLWISEAVANYAALLYERNRLRLGGGQRVGRGPTSGWTQALETLAADGRPVEALGPVVMGSRLNSSLSTDAYQTIVYQKGAVVLDMLARLYGEEAFVRILHEIVTVAADRVISTDEFLLLLERIGGADLEWFKRQYILGTGLPEILYDYRVDSTDDGRWIVEGQATQKSSYRYSHRVIESQAGRLDVIREAAARLDVDKSILVVPFQIGLATTTIEDLKIPEEARRLIGGRIVLQGKVSPFRLELDEEPEIFWLDRFQEVFGRFLSESRWPRRAAFLRGRDLLAAGDLETAESVLLDSLQKPVMAAEPEWLGYQPDVERAAQRVDTEINLELARLYLDQGRQMEAAERLSQARQRLRRADRWLFERKFLPLDGRLELLSGDVDQAYRTLRKGLGSRVTAASAEAWALYAVTAHLAGHDKEYRRACGHARDRGVDLGPLECP